MLTLWTLYALYVSDSCDTSTACYPYKQGDLMQHTWRNLTCNDSCQLILKDGSPPPIPVPISNITSITNTHHPSPGITSSGNINRHRNQFDPRSKSPTSIALISVCTIVSFFLVIWLIRIIFYKTKYWPWINKYFCCGFCNPPIVPLSSSSLASSLSQNTASTPNTRPPSFQSNINNSSIIYTAMRQHSINSHNSSNSSLPSYHCQDPSLPKYEQAIVTQIRGMSLFDHPSSSSSSSSTQQQPIWIPIYLSSSSINNSTIVSSPIFNSFLPSNSDWASPTNIRHQPLMRSQSSLSIEEITEQQDNDNEEEERRRVGRT